MRKDARAFGNCARLTESIVANGLWRTAQDIEKGLMGKTETAKKQCLKDQIQYRKNVMKQPPPHKKAFVMSQGGVVTVSRLVEVLNGLLRGEKALERSGEGMPDWKGRKFSRGVDAGGSWVQKKGVVMSVERLGKTYNVHVQYENGEEAQIDIVEVDEEMESGIMVWE